MRTIPALALLTGCWPFPPPTTTTPPTTTPPTTTTTDSGTTTSTPGACAQATIGAAGGQLALPDATVTVPAGALSADTDLSLCPAAVSGAWVAWELLPADLALLAAAEATLVHGGDDAVARMFASDGAGGAYRSLAAATSAPGALTGPLWHGGALYVAEDPRVAGPYAPMADLLVVVDNTCSMADEQAALGVAFIQVIPTLDARSLDYHVGVVTTDLDDPDHSGRLREVDGVRWVDRATPSSDQVFQDMAQVGTTGSGLERGLGAAHLALEDEADAYNAGFLRDEATLAVLVLSDEDDDTEPGLIDPPGFVAWLEALRPADEVALHAVVDPARGTVYADVAAATGGREGDITAPAGWPALLEGVVDDLSVGDTATLPAGLDPAAIEVWWVPPGAEQERIPAGDVTYDPATGLLTVTTLHPAAELVVVY